MCLVSSGGTAPRRPRRMRANRFFLQSKLNYKSKNAIFFNFMVLFAEISLIVDIFVNLFSVQTMAQPDFKMMWVNFPDHKKYPTLRALHTFIGGQLAANISSRGFGPNGNTCAVRMSRALNYGNMPIRAKLAHKLSLTTLTGADGHVYIFRVRELRTYLAAAIGTTPKRVTKQRRTKGQQ